MTFSNSDFVNKDLKHRNNSLDERILFTTRLLDELPLDTFESILDVGMGRGEFSLYFSQKGKKVTGTGINLSSYNIDVDLLKNNKIDIVECHINKMPFEDNQFDAVFLSHILEHCFDLSVALQEVRRVLKKDGYLFVFLPEYVSEASAVHAITGWNVGQLLITLLLNGFNVKNGKFLHKEHQVCAFVQKSQIDLPVLRGDSGDNYILYKAGFFPDQIEFSDKNFESFEGNIASINWETKIKQNISYSNKQKLLISISRLFPKQIIRIIIFYLRAACNTLNSYWFTTKG